MPGYPEGKPAGEPCRHLTSEGHCSIHGLPGYPDVCRKFSATEEVCGLTKEDSFRILAELEELTKP